MSATVVSPFRNQQVVWEESFPQVDGGPIAPRFDRVSANATLAAFVGPSPNNADQGFTCGIPALHRDRKTPVVLRSQEASDWRFANFPEFQAARFDGVVFVPLLDSGETVGLANFCHIGEAPISASSLSFLMSLSLPLGALLIASTLRDGRQKATQDLAGRKLLERAKGLLQARFQLTEKDAYLRIRRLSRRSRTPMRDIAQLVIETGVESLTEVFETA
jgi:hypothetical protein